MEIRKYVVIVLCLGLFGCSSLLNRMPTPVIQEKDTIYLVKAGTQLDLYYSGGKVPTLLNEDRFLVSESFLISMASDKTSAILKKVKAKKDANKILIIVGSICALFASIAGVVLTGKIKSLIPKKIVATVESK